jgi:recombination protein RecA
MDLSKIQRKFVKKYGQRSISIASDQEALSRITYGLSSQSLSLDLALGRSGFPAGRLTEIVGLTHTGKSTLLYHVLAECQRLGGISVLVETENAFEASRLESVGVKSKDLILLQPEYIEQALEMILEVMEDIRKVQKFTGPIAIGLDTIAGTPCQVEVEGGYDEKFMAAAARSIALGLRKLIRPLAEYQTVLIFLNQLRSSMEQYGDKWVSYGGKAIGSSSSIRVRLNSMQKDLVRENGKLLGTWTNAYTIKNKLATPFQLTKYFLNFEHGIDPIEDLWRVALHMKILKVSQKSFKLTIGDKSAQVDRSKFEDFIITKFKSPQKLKERLTQIAVEQKLLKPYGG